MSIYVLRRDDGALQVGQTGHVKSYVRTQMGGGVSYDSSWNGGPAAMRELQDLLAPWKIVKGTKGHHDKWYSAEAEPTLREYLSTRGRIEIEGIDLPATPKNNIVRMRLTALEKGDWVKAAGGSGRLSEWIRAVCNAAAEHARISAEGPPPVEVEREPIQNVKPLIVEAAIAASVNEGGEGQEELSESSMSMPAAQPSAVAGLPLLAPPDAPTTSKAQMVKPTIEQCPRWMHHRPGTYCGACKKVIKK